MKNIKNYPLRITKNVINVPLYKYHICDKCVTIVIINDNGEYNIYYDKCKFEKKISTESISIVDYSDEIILNSKDVVIKNETFSICVNKIGRKEYYIRVKGEDKSFTVSELLKIYKKILYYMYYNEEISSSLKNYLIKKSCNCIISTNFQEEFVENIEENIEETDIDNMCVICNDDNKCNIKINCNHSYHKSCLKEWSKQSKLCPLCRKKFVICNKCENKGYTYIYKSYKLLPKKYRLNYSRPKTDGIFNIDKYNIEDIYINSLKYDTKKKILYFNIDEINDYDDYFY
jgi:hypothetical protein